METTLFLLAILSVFLTVWFGTLLVTMVGLMLAGRKRNIPAMQFVMAAVPVTYLVWFFLMR